jgi:hypothetical protein
VDLEIGRVLQQVVDRGLHRELGFASIERYVTERLDLSPRTARRLIRLARAERRAPAVASAFRAGRITLLQAEALLRGGSVAFAERVTLRRLEDEVPRRRVEFQAPAEVAALFLAQVAAYGLEAMIDHAIASWLEAGRGFRDYADFERDGWRCTVPACSARRNLESPHPVPLCRRAGRAVEPDHALRVSPRAGRTRGSGRNPGARPTSCATGSASGYFDRGTASWAPSADRRSPRYAARKREVSLESSSVGA